MPSSVIRSFAYHAETRRLDVLFATGWLYAYFDAPPEDAAALAAAFSKGRAFNRRIRDRYRYRRIGRAR